MNISTAAYNHRGRVLCSLAHREPDRVPVDLGGMDSTGIHAIAYKNLKKYLGISSGRIRVFDPYQMVATVEREILDQIGADVLPVPFDAREYETGTLPDGTEAEFPAKWKPVRLADGSEIVLESTGKVIARRLEAGLYFEPVSYPLAETESIAEIESHREVFESFDWPFFCDQTLEEIGTQARQLCEGTDFLLMGNFAVHIFSGGQLLRGFEKFLIDLVTNPSIAHCILDNLTNVFIQRFSRYAETVGPYVQVINVNDDMGTQTRTMISPQLYRKIIKPYQARLYSYIKQKWPGYLFLHSDGAIAPLIPDLIEIGVDILNPVQLHAHGMDPMELKRQFGDVLSFWGGGCDTQKVLPFGNSLDVRDEVRKRLDQLAPGGGFVFNQVHNIQPDVPPENIIAMYETVAEFSHYS
jgi:uroporphyrinogen decarboxylase